MHFVPGACPSKTGAEPTIGLVAEAAGQYATGLKIGVASMRLQSMRLRPFGRFTDQSWNLFQPLVVI